MSCRRINFQLKPEDVVLNAVLGGNQMILSELTLNVKISWEKVIISWGLYEKFCICYML